VKEIGGEYVFVEKNVFQEANTKPQASSAGRRGAQERDFFEPQRDRKVPRPATVKPEHIQSDFAQQHVLANLRVLAQCLHDQALATNDAGQPMLIVSELNFKNYLNVSHYNKATAKMAKIKGHGDFDFLVFTKNGVVVAEMKSIGLMDDVTADEVLKDRVSKAFKQLDKGVTVAMTANSDVAPGVPVRASLFLPYVSSQQLQHVLQQDVKLIQVS
jgi:propanediol dehydratase small subunit